MITCWNIASLTRPTSFDKFTECLKGVAKEHQKLELKSMVVAAGPGCNNYGMMLEGEEEDAEVFIRQVTMALQPAKYSQLPGDPLLQDGVFKDYLA